MTLIEPGLCLLIGLGCQAVSLPLGAVFKDEWMMCLLVAEPKCWVLVCHYAILSALQVEHLGTVLMPVLRPSPRDPVNIEDAH